MKSDRWRLKRVFYIAVCSLLLLSVRGLSSTSDADATIFTHPLHPEVKEAFNACKDSAGLHELVQELEESDFPIWILPQIEGKENNHTLAMFPKSAETPGQGSGSWIRWRHKGQGPPIAIKCNASDCSVTIYEDEDRCASLYHELTHAQQNIEGRSRWRDESMGRPVKPYATTCSYEDKDGQRHDKGTPIIDVEAVRAENKYRRLHGLPERCCYDEDMPLPPPDIDCDDDDKYKKSKPRTYDSVKKPLEVPERKKAPQKSTRRSASNHPPAARQRAPGTHAGTTLPGFPTVPQASASSVGDPHLFPFDGMDYDFQAAGEFTALRSESGDMVVQVRQVPWKDSRWVSVTSAIAVKVTGDRLTIEFHQDSLVLRIKGNPNTLNERKSLPGGGFVIPNERGYIIGWPDGSLLRALRNVRGVDIALHLTPARAGTVHGLLGPFNNEPGEVLETKDGKTITKDNIKEYRQLYRVFGDSWRISQAESLFDYAAGTSTATYQKKDFPDPNPPKLDPRKEASARETCLRAGVPERALAGCILDVAITGEAGFATTTAAAMQPLASPLPAEKTTPSTKDQPNAQTFTIKLGDHVAVDKPGKGAGRIESPGARDLYTFTAAAGSLVYLKADPNCKNSKLRWGLQDPTGAFFLYLQDQYEMCTDPGRALLKTAGTYTVVVKGDKDATGDYGFALQPVGADQTFALKIGDHVGVDKPGKGAGRIEVAGAIDRYTFSAPAGTLIYLKSESPCTREVGWGVQDAAGAWVSQYHDAANVCDDIGRTLLKAGGTYTTIVKGRGNATGDYGFALQPDHK